MLEFSRQERAGKFNLFGFDLSIVGVLSGNTDENVMIVLEKHYQI